MSAMGHERTSQSQTLMSASIATIEIADLQAVTGCSDPTVASEFPKPMHRAVLEIRRWFWYSNVGLLNEHFADCSRVQTPGLSGAGRLNPLR